MKKTVIGDILVTAAALLLAALLFAVPFFVRSSGNDELFLSVTVRNGSVTEVLSYPLSVDRTFTVENNGITLTVVISDSRAYVSDSDCGNRVCVNSGSVSKKGQSIICAPAGVALTVTGGSDDVDAVAE